MPNDELLDFEFWNYRVMIGHDSFYSIRQVFYSERGDIMSWSPEPVKLYDFDVQDVYNNYVLMGEAFDRPILMERDLTNQIESYDEEDTNGNSD